MVSQDSDNENICLVVKNMVTVVVVKDIGQPQWPSFTPGDIVILKDDLAHRCWWKLARVTELITSRDGRVRAAKILVLYQEKNATASLQNLIPTELSMEQ